MPPPADSANHVMPARVLPVWAYGACLFACVVAMLASGALVGQHLFNIKLPGCSAGGSGGAGGTMIAQPVSACASLEAHPMGSIGGMRIGFDALRSNLPMPKITTDQAFWPTSFLGAAFFFAMLMALAVLGLSGRRVPRLLRIGIWFGALVSVSFLVVIVVSKKPCQYCITSHIANLLLLAMMEVGLMMSAKFSRSVPAARATSGARVLVAALVAFMLSSVVMGAQEARNRQADREKGEATLAQANQDLAAKVAADNAKAAGQGGNAEPTDPWPSGLKARWNLGPEQAQVRVVVLSSYQCPDCKRIEGEAMTLLEKYKGKMSLGFMHFPLCGECNKFVKGDHDPHPNSCWAARAAEAAGMLGGTDGFWKMHKWLFEHSGSFTNQEIRDGVKQLGFDETTFMTLMQAPGTLAPIDRDVEVGEKLGLYFTPLVFVNGVEMRAWNVPGGLIRAVDTVMLQSPAQLTAAVDKPVLAAQKFIDDWRVMPTVPMPKERQGRSIGPVDAQVQIVIFGDYAEPNTKLLVDAVTPLCKDPASPARLIYRHFPGEQSCNPKLPKTFYANGCIAAQAAEGAAIIAGEEGFWKMHDWLFAFPDKTKLSVNEIKRGANALGIDAGKLEALIGKPETQSALGQDIAAAQSAGVVQIPQVFVNGKFVQRWSRENDKVMKRIIEQARKDASAKP